MVASSETANPANIPPEQDQRQKNPTLRGLVNGLLEHIRDLSGRVDDLSPEELEYEHERFNTIADLMWAAITDEKKRPAAARKK